LYFFLPSADNLIFPNKGENLLRISCFPRISAKMAEKSESNIEWQMNKWQSNIPSPTLQNGSPFGNSLPKAP
jgi:hypothetical protein